MKIFRSLYNGVIVSAKSWKGVLITWLFSLIMVSVLAIPLRGALKSALGKSMITEKLMDGFDPAVLSELGPSLKVVLSFFSAGLFLLLIIGFLVNIFFAGGLFNSVRSGVERRTFQEFFRSSARHFGSYLVITLLIRLILNFISGFTIALPLVIVASGNNISTKATIIIVSAGILLTIIVLSVLLLVIDYARAWQASNEKSACFSAMGFGFSETFKRFWSSLPMMLIILLIQVLYILSVFFLISGWNPLSGGETLLLFFVSQILVFGKILLKTWRFASVTSLMEENSKAKSQDQSFQVF
jgi:hypothetical protein